MKPKSLACALFLSAWFCFNPAISALDYELLTPDHITESVWMKELGIKQERIRLKNGLCVWLVEAPKAPLSVMAVSVDSGSFDDPAMIMGGAHLVEHATFMGSESFPEESSFDIFIKKALGKNNAHTCPHFTAYGFTCDNNLVEEAIHRFSDMIQKPLIRQESIDREKQAVNEEFRQKISSEGYRGWLIFCDLIENSHPLHKLGCGNAKTLDQVQASDLKKWHDAHYHPQGANLFLLSNQSLEAQRQWVLNYWSQWQAKEPSSPEREISLPKLSFDSSYFVKRVSLIDKNSLDLVWILPCDSPEDKHSLSLLASLLGHELPGGLSSYLKSEGYALSLGAGSYSMGNIGQLSLSIDLTNKGLEEIQTCLAICQSYIETLSKASIEKSWIDKQESIVKTAWQSFTMTATLEQGFFLIDSLADESMTTFPYRSQWLGTENIQKAQQYASCLKTQEAMKLLSVYDKNTLSKTTTLRSAVEPWSESAYEIISFEAERISQPMDVSKINWVVTADNPFLPQFLPSFTHLEPSKTGKVLNGSFGKLVYYPNSFESGLYDSVCWTMKPSSPSIDINNRMFWPLFIEIARAKLYDFFDQTIEAGQFLSISPESEGLSLCVNGYSAQTQKQVLQALFSKILSLEIDTSFFNQQKQKLLDYYKADLKQGPLDKFSSLMSEIFIKDTPSLDEKIHLLEEINFPSFQKMYQSFLYHPLSFTAIAISAKEPQEWHDFFEEAYQSLKIKAPASLSDELFPNFPFPQVLVAPSEKVILTHHKQNEGNLALMVWQLPRLDSEAAEKIYLEAKIFETDLGLSAFHNLRTQEQLGYIVQAGIKVMGNTPHLILLVLSSNKPEDELTASMKRQIEIWRDLISKTDPVSFETMKNQFQTQINQRVETSYSQLQKLLAFWPRDGDPLIAISKQKEILDRITYKEAQKNCIEFLSQEPYQIYCLPQVSKE